MDCSFCLKLHTCGRGTCTTSLLPLPARCLTDACPTPWDDDARGAVFGLTRGSNKHHFIRACLDAIAYQCKDVFEVMEKETGSKIRNLKVDGGATENNYLMQFQSDILQTNIMLPKTLETTALGVAYLAGLNSGFYSSLDEIRSIHSYKAIFAAKMDAQEAQKHYNGWLKAVEATRIFK